MSFGSEISEARGNPKGRQIITLAFLCKDLPATLIGERLARELNDQRKAATVLVKFEWPGLTTSNPALNGKFHLPQPLLPVADGLRFITLSVRETPPSPAGIESMIVQLRRHFRYVLVAAPPDDELPSWVEEFMVRSDLTYAFVRPTDAGSAQMHALLARQIDRRDHRC